MRYPWIPICAALILGILLSPLDPAQAGTLRVGTILVAACALGAALWGRRSLAFIFALAAFALCGAALHSAAMAPGSPDRLPRLESAGELRLDRLIELEGVVRGHPERRPDLVKLTLDVERISQSGTSREAEGGILVTVYLSERWQERELPFRAGDRVRMLTRLKKPRRPGNPGGFDYAGYLRLRGITHICSLKSPMAVEILGRGCGLPGSSLFSSLRATLGGQVRRHFARHGVLSQRGALLEAMLIGNRGMISQETKNLLRRLGLLHVIAISGYHVWALSLICFLLLRSARIPDRWASVVTIVVISFYWAVAGGRSSAGRACLVGIVFLLGRVFDKRSNSVNNLAFAACCILAVAPTELYNVGFHLTFAAALSITLLYKPLNRLFRPLGWAGSLLAISVAAKLGVMPIVALNFNTVTLHGIVTNALLVPVLGLIIILGFLFLFAAAALPALGWLLAVLVSFLLGLTLEVIRLLDALLPLAIHVPEPPLWLLVAYYVSLPLWLALIRKAEAVAKIVVRAAPAVVAAALISVNPFVVAPRGHYRLHAIDVGQGEALLLELPDGSAALIDGGGTPLSDFDVGQSVVCDFLWHRGHRRIDLMVSTHSDTDHLEGLLSVAENFPVRELWLTSAAQENDNLRHLLRTAERGGWVVRRLSRGRTLRWRSTRWHVLGPPAEPYAGPEASNDNSLVALVEIGRYSIMLTGDAERGPLDETAALYGERLRCDVLKVAHHGSDDALSLAFLEAAAPRLALISAQLDNVHRFPRPAVIDALEQDGITILRTDLQGALSLTFKANKIEVRRGR